MARNLISMSAWRFLSSVLEEVKQDKIIGATVVTAIKLLFLLSGLYLSRKLMKNNDLLWIALPLLLSATLVKATYSQAETASVRLLQLIGCVSALYSLFHYPVLPVSPERPMAGVVYALLVTLWIASVACGPMSLRVPSLAVIPAAFLLWSKLVAVHITGLQHRQILDVVPLSDVAICLAIGLVADRALNAIARIGGPSRSLELSREIFASVAIVTAISIHLANYFSSFRAKISLDGDPLAWLMTNNPSNLLLVAFDNNHLFYSSFNYITEVIRYFLERTHLVTNGLVLAAQALAIAGFLMPRRALTVLLLGYDAMHVSIMLASGANFWPWILLNVVITAVVWDKNFKQPKLAIGLYAAALMLTADNFGVFRPAFLGWYDTKANNKLYFQAIGEKGDRYVVPTNFFTFYSYPLSHMDYGTPEPETAFSIGNPNGGAKYFWKVLAAEKCDVQGLQKSDGRPRDGANRPLDVDSFNAFIRNYHKMVLSIEERLGIFPYNVYPHHFFVPINQGALFNHIEKRRIVAYVYKRESVCLQFTSSGLTRRVISEAEHRINVVP
jgi:hypothetical protein